MRTPGNDGELATGLLFSDGIIAGAGDVLAISDSAHANTVRVELAPEIRFEREESQRLTVTNSACGVCGRREIMRTPARSNPKALVTFSSQLLCGLPEQLRRAQDVFEQTGGLHAAGLFSSAGELVLVREDVGRHNALDKLIGCCVLERRSMESGIVVVSGRAGYELVQKCVAAGVPALAAIGAPSSLAAQVADEYDLTLIGFLRADRFNVYTGGWRVRQALAGATRDESG
jgi:FdhD protein